MTGEYVVVSPEQTVKVDDEYEVRTRLLDAPGKLRFRRIGGDEDWSSVALYAHDGHLPSGWRSAGQLFEVSARWGDNPATILVRRATRQ
jgi:hypothetical protein